MTEELCEFCQKENFKYSCPRCNRLYCSVPCYQSKEHVQCSESFYRDCVIQELASEQTENQRNSVSAHSSESTQKMYEILQRVQNENSNPDNPDDENDDEYGEDEEDESGEEVDSDDDGPPTDLAERLATIDLNDADAVWANLNDEERQNFESLVCSGDAMTLVPAYEPWWQHAEHNPLIEVIETEKSKDLEPSSPAIVFPEIHNKIPEFDRISIRPPAPVVRHNVTNVLAAYTITVRFFDGDHNRFPHEAAACVVALSANLKANQTFDTQSAAIDSAQNEGAQIGVFIDDECKSRCRRDIADILGGAGNSLPSHQYVLIALSEVYRLLLAARDLKTPASEPEKGVCFSKQFGDFAPATFDELKRSKLSVHIKKIEYLMAFAKKFL